MYSLTRLTHNSLLIEHFFILKVEQFSKLFDNVLVEVSNISNSIKALFDKVNIFAGYLHPTLNNHQLATVKIIRDVRERFPRNPDVRV